MASNPNSIDGIRSRLGIDRSGQVTLILLDGAKIGTIVRYGKGGNRGSMGSRTVYGSRNVLLGTAPTVEVEASTTTGVLDKVAAHVARAIRNGQWVPPEPTPAEPEAVSGEAPVPGLR